MLLRWLTAQPVSRVLWVALIPRTPMITRVSAEQVQAVATAAAAAAAASAAASVGAPPMSFPRGLLWLQRAAGVAAVAAALAVAVAVVTMMI